MQTIKTRGASGERNEIERTQKTGESVASKEDPMPLYEWL